MRGMRRRTSFARRGASRDAWRQIPRAVVLVAAALAAARGQQEQPEATVRVAVIPKGATHEHWKRVHIGAEKAARSSRRPARPSR